MRIYAKRSIKDRFNEKWTPEPFSGCWLWSGGLMVSGYGMLFVKRINDKKKKFDGAHRISWQIVHGEIPNGLRVLHKCDTPSCVNPDHLFLGTASDNTHDSIRKGRFVFRTGRPNKKKT